jgi:hypothetical protein
VLSLGVFTVLIVAAPPGARLGPRAAGGGVLPFFLSAEGCQVEECPDVQALDATAVSEVGAIDIFTVVDEDAQAVLLVLVGGEAEVLVEVGALGGVPRKRPSHPFLEFLNVLQRREGDQAERSIAGVEMRRLAELVGHH